LTSKLLDHLKTKLIEKHESNCALKEMCSTMTQNFTELESAHAQTKAEIEAYQELERAYENCSSLK